MSVLREAAETAARERTRLAASAGRSRTGAVLASMPGRLRHLGSEDAARSGLRYQPIVWTLIIVAAVAFYFPGRDGDTGGAPAATRTTAPAARFVMPTTVPAAAPELSSTPPPAPRVSSTPTPVAAPPPRPVASAPVPTTVPPAEPLAVRGFGWASSLSGSGLSTADVPEGTMPVATRLGQLDKVSFIRLSGTETTLTLVEDEDGAREALGAGVIVICPITEPGWAEEPDQSLDDAPAWDTNACVAGVEGDDNTWTFDLAAFTDRTGDAGFALVPDASAPPDFQVTFQPS